MSRIIVYLSCVEIISKYSLMVKIFMNKKWKNLLTTCTHRKALRDFIDLHAWWCEMILYERASYPEMDGPFVRYYYCSNHRRLAKYVLLWSYFSSKTLNKANWKIYQGWQCSVNISFCGCIFLLENSKSIKTKMLLLETLKLHSLIFLSAGEIMSSVIILIV